MLQIPPVKKVWATGDAAKSHVLATDDIAMWDETNATYVFTDISYGLPRRVGPAVSVLLKRKGTYIVSQAAY